MRQIANGMFRMLGGVSLGALAMVGGVGSAAAQVAATGSPAVDKTAPQPAVDSPTNDAASEEDILITGSRIRGAGYDQPTPVTVMPAEELLTTNPANIADGLNQLPQFQGSRTRVFCCEIVSVGNYLNLRGLGSQRTLVLLDGKRVVPTREAGDVDVNLLPELLIQRIDVVTGGASAAYGSDAVSGVVNYVIDNKLEGVKAAVQSGISGFGDDGSVKLQVAAGSAFAGDRGHFVVSLEHFKTDGIPSLDARPLSDDGHFLGGNGSAAAPYVALNGVRQNTGSYGGVIINAAGVPVANAAAPLAGIDFFPNGTTGTFILGGNIPGSSPNFTLGGSGFLNNLADPAQSLRTDRGYFRASYDLSDSITAYARLNVGRSRNKGDVLANSAAGTAAITIFNDNAYLPPQVLAAMNSANVTSFRFARFNRDFGVIALDYKNRTYDVNVGLEGKFANGWSWDASYAKGATVLNGRVERATVLANLYAASDAVRNPANGQVVCRVTLTNPGVFPGCVPINLFGEGTPSAAAKDYVLDSSVQRVRNSQELFAVEVQGELVQLPAGALSFAAGGEYRQRDLLEVSNPTALGQIQATGVRGFPTAFCPTATTCRFGGFNQGNFGEANGKDTIKEVFGEVQVPLLRDKPFFHSLELNGAYRYTDYTNSGGVGTYKVGGTWEPFSGFRIRAVRSLDIRAPNLFELFAGPVNAFQAGLVDPVTRTSNVIGITRTEGNPNLKPERAKTTTIGLVYTPSWLPGFAGSIDYYDINLTGALSATTAQSTLDQCFGGDTEACSRITRDAAGNLQQIRLLQINLDRRRVKGIDFDLSYSRNIGGGRFGARLVANHAIDYLDTVGGITTQLAGGFRNLLAIPRWRGNLALNYEKNGASLSIQERYIGKYEQLPPVPGQVFAEPTVPRVFYTDVTAKMAVPSGTSEFEVFATINNLFNKTPPFVPNRFAAALAFPTSAHSLYDIDNRYFTVGAKMKF